MCIEEKSRIRVSGFYLSYTFVWNGSHDLLLDVTNTWLSWLPRAQFDKDIEYLFIPTYLLGNTTSIRKILIIKLATISSVGYLQVSGLRYIWKIMASPARVQKRKSSADRSISPPPLRRKVQSTTTRKLHRNVWRIIIETTFRDCCCNILYAYIAKATWKDFLARTRSKWWSTKHAFGWQIWTTNQLSYRGIITQFEKKQSCCFWFRESWLHTF